MYSFRKPDDGEWKRIRQSIAARSNDRSMVAQRHPRPTPLIMIQKIVKEEEDEFPRVISPLAFFIGI
jgi:hypothetical protein